MSCARCYLPLFEFPRRSPASDWTVLLVHSNAWFPSDTAFTRQFDMLKWNADDKRSDYWSHVCNSNAFITHELIYYTRTYPRGLADMSSVYIANN